jgi:polyhydroxyalkanoate synthase
VQRDASPLDNAVGPVPFALAPFAIGDVLRSAQGEVLAAFGLGPNECPYRIIASGLYWRLRDYAGDASANALLVVAAPIKRPYIWDLAPSVSAIRRCLRQRLHVFLLEWLPASSRSGNIGLDENVQAIADCIARISSQSEGLKPFLAGHSLGGTLAAIFAATAPASIRGLLLLGACFQPRKSHFRDALVALAPPDLSDADPFPGSLLSHISAMASPVTFIWSRQIDAFSSLTDPHALDIHLRVERWALDEVALPGKLVDQMINWLYRDNRFCRGTLKIGEQLVGPINLSAPTLAVVNLADDVAPPASVKPFAEAMRAGCAQVIEYPGEVGVCLQHLGILVGREAHKHIWPQIISWLGGHREIAAG